MEIPYVKIVKQTNLSLTGCDPKEKTSDQQIFYRNLENKMNIGKAALAMRDLVKASSLPEHHPEYGKDHMYEMIYKIELGDRGEVSGEKAHRWLGYIQGCVVCYGGATLEDVKNVNLTD